eukprot:TRINITY_DN1286_c0_g1_i5.p1 TRINITY_DN1286_c0_g1~~TRINITY_DN1286_c0_g1_i5.p1  ORF type:complete len:388 (+),score=39.41 TRINITY_DN1286_c0_g1_i5:80-1243(+)
MSVLALFGAIKGFLVPDSKADIANYVLCFSRFMFVILLAFSILPTAKQYFGEPITCNPTHATSALKANLINNYCYINGTTTVIPRDRTRRFMHNEIYRGIFTATHDNDDFIEVRHTYYQWVPFILFLQALAFYLPFHMWSRTVGERIDKLLVKVSKDPLTSTSVSDQVLDLCKFLEDKPNYFNSHAYKRFFIDGLALFLAVIQMYILDLIFMGQYFGLGCDFYTIRNAFWEYQLIVEEMFPIATKCGLPWMSTGGEWTTEHALCVMNINILNQKLFVISWLLHMSFICVALLMFVWEMLVIMVPFLRYVVLRYSVSNVNGRVLSYVHRRCSYGQYVLLTILAQNMDVDQFDAVISLLVADCSRNVEDTSSDNCLNSGSSLVFRKLQP